MKPRERVQAAVTYSEPDFTPYDYFATPEINEALMTHFQVSKEDEIRDCLGTDLRYLNPPYIGPPVQTFSDGSTLDEWGVRRRPMPNEYGEYMEPVGQPYLAFETVEDVDRFPWPDPDWYDFAALPAMCAEYEPYAIVTGGFWVQDFINRVAMGRGVEQVFLDIAEQSPVYIRLIEIRHQFYMRYIERILEAASGRIDLVLCGDDFGSQNGLLISPSSYDRLFSQFKREFFDMVHSFGAWVTHHCCGSCHDLIPRFIDCGMDILQAIQPRANGMDPYSLKSEFTGQIVLHGGVDVQGWMQQATPIEIRQEIHNLMDKVGGDGGFILAPCHHLQPDIPLENVLAMYDAVAEVRTGRRFTSR